VTLFLFLKTVAKQKKRLPSLSRHGFFLNLNKMKGWMYILKCCNDKFYTGSTNNLEVRLNQHQKGVGAKFTKSHLPVKLVYFEEFDSIYKAFYREKQIQNWSHHKKQALIDGDIEKLKALSRQAR